VTEPAHQIEPLITAEQAGQILGRNADWMYRQAAAGRIPSYKIDGQRGFLASEIVAYRNQHAEGPREKMAPVTQLDRRR